MTTIVPFVPSNQRAPSIPATLDGSPYNIVITWNVSAQRYYINIYDTNGNWILTTALVSTPPARQINTTVYDPFLNQVTVTMVDPSLWPVPLALEGINIRPGQIIDYTLLGFQPNTYNGLFRCLHIDPITFTFPMLTDPGQVLIMGSVNRMLNMIEPLFVTSTLVYRNGSFEINP